MRRIDLILNAVFLIAILVLGYLLTTAGSNQDDGLDTSMAGHERRGGEESAGTMGSESDFNLSGETNYGAPGTAETGYVAPIVQPQEDLFVNLLQRNVFTTIIPTPTATPTPTPRPVLPDPLADVINGWKLRMILDDEAHIEDTAKPGEMIVLKAVSAGGTPVKKTFKGIDFEIWAVEVNDMEYTVTVECDKHSEKYETLGF
jgi:hypothetical protein